MSGARDCCCSDDVQALVLTCPCSSKVGQITKADLERAYTLSVDRLKGAAACSTA